MRVDVLEWTLNDDDDDDDLKLNRHLGFRSGHTWCLPKFLFHVQFLEFSRSLH